MNNKFLSIIIILILASFVSIFTILVSAEWEEEPSTEGRVHLFEGWNIVSYYAIDEWNFDALQKNEITAIFMYNSFDKEYIRLYPNHDVEKMKEFYSKLVAINKIILSEIWQFGFIPIKS